jgi:hypothetical protein
MNVLQVFGLVDLLGWGKGPAGDDYHSQSARGK